MKSIQTRDNWHACVSQVLNSRDSRNSAVAITMTLVIFTKLINCHLSPSFSSAPASDVHVFILMHSEVRVPLANEMFLFLAS